MTTVTSTATHELEQAHGKPPTGAPAESARTVGPGDTQAERDDRRDTRVVAAAVKPRHRSARRVVLG
jgi:hypothetical protein